MPNGHFGDFHVPAPIQPATDLFPPICAVSSDRTIAGVNGSNSAGGIGVYGAGATAGKFEGNVEVTGRILHSGDLECRGTALYHGNINCKQDIQLLNADCAEDFDIAEAEDIEPGTVVVLDNDGALRQSRQPYDKKVAGVVSGAAGFKPGIILDKQQSKTKRMPIALIG